MNESLNSLFQLDESAVVGNGYDPSGDTASHGELLVNLLPRIRSKLLQTQGDPAAGLVEIQNLDVYILLKLNDLRRVIDPPP